MGTERTTALATTLEVTMLDGSVWGVPVMAIARDRASTYAYEFDGDIDRSLAEDTLPLFTGSGYEVTDWAVNNMDWSDVASVAKKIRDTPYLTDKDMQEAWVNGNKRLSDALEA